jgi:hypothetical protein
MVVKAFTGLYTGKKKGISFHLKKETGEQSSGRREKRNIVETGEKRAHPWW